MESGDAGEKFILRSWHWSLILFVSLLFYLMLGAFVFRAVEIKHSHEAHVMLYEGLAEFLENHPCVSQSDLQLIGNNLSFYLSRGVSLMRRYRIDTKAKEIESTWSLSNAFILALTIITTIGYGDMVPRTDTGKLFCMFYALVGVPLMAFTLSVFGKTLERFARRYTRRLNLSHTSTRWGKLRLVAICLLTAILLVLLLSVLPGCLVSVYERWEFWDSCYFFFITITTIGFGDLSIGDCQRCGNSLWLLVVFFTLYIFIGMCVISFLFTAVSEYQKRKLQTVESLLVTFVAHRHESQEVNTTGSVTYDQSIWGRSLTEGALYKKRIAQVRSRTSDGGITNFGHEYDQDECDFDVDASASNIHYPVVQLNPRQTIV